MTPGGTKPISHHVSDVSLYRSDCFFSITDVTPSSSTVLSQFYFSISSFLWNSHLISLLQGNVFYAVTNSTVTAKIHPALGQGRDPKQYSSSFDVNNKILRTKSTLKITFILQLFCLPLVLLSSYYFFSPHPLNILYLFPPPIF